MISRTENSVFHGWKVVAAAFVLAVFGWGMGFYGPPVYLHAVREARGWPLALVSSAITTHYLCGVAVIVNLPRLYTRFGVPRVTKAGSISLALGVLGWAIAREPWELFAATVLSGAGWVTMGAAAVNAVVAPWFIRKRPAALSAAYNGSSIGGVVFSPLWVAAIDLIGFPFAAAVIGLVMIFVIWFLADRYFAKTPAQMNLAADGDAAEPANLARNSPPTPALAGGSPWRDWRFVTLAAGTAFGLFAQIGLLAHLYSLLVPALGAQFAGFAAGAATASAIAGRTLAARLMPTGGNRRFAACASYGVQIVGSLMFLLAAGHDIPLLLVGVVLFGAGIGNATSIPPLIAQAEFSKEDLLRVVPLVIAVGQATYAFAPAIFGVIRELGPQTIPGTAPALFIAAASVQALAIGALLVGRRLRSELMTG